LAHELNQPIGASRIDLHSLKNLLKKQNLYTNEVKELLERMEFDNQRTGGIVRTLRSIFGQDRPVVESVPISVLVQSTVDLAIREMKSADIAIDINIPKELVINIGRIEMQQVLLNLLNNAIHALKEFDTPNAKSIWIAARKTDANAIEIMVQDNGPGVDPTIANNIFTLFLTKKKSGLGVGLWLCQYILSRYGAELSYRPRAGGGSAFIIRMKDSQ
jgi:C4-dicarboxylate-specific signal transduction histidine kinase